jgi:hypothetical protein
MMQQCKQLTKVLYLAPGCLSALLLIFDLYKISQPSIGNGRFWQFIWLPVFLVGGFTGFMRFRQLFGN